MARTIVFVPTASPGAPALIDFDEIPQDVVEDVEDVYATLKANPNGRMQIVFKDKAELATFVIQATSYCAQRPAGQIRLRKSPVKDLPDNVLAFRVTDLLTENEAKTEEIREAVETVKKGRKAA